MRFSEIKRFAGGGLGEVTTYLAILGSGLRDLFTGLYQLDFLDNFQSFSWTGAIAAGAEVGIPNGLKTIPRYWAVLDATATADFSIARGTNAWTTSIISLKNFGASGTVTVTVIFFR